MQRKSFTGMKCSIAKALEEVGEWWSLLIVRECMQGSARFEEFQAVLGIARNTLTTRLERLTKVGVLERFPVEDRANTEGYRLTEKGEALYPVIVSLMQWGDTWTSNKGKQPTLLVDDLTGHPIEQIAVRGPRGRALSHHDVRYAPGPGATSKSSETIDKRNARVLRLNPPKR